MRYERLDCWIHDKRGNQVDGPYGLLDAMPRMRALGVGHRVVRSDGVVLGFMPRGMTRFELVLIREDNDRYRRVA